jgi:hypothetical protein
VSNKKDSTAKVKVNTLSTIPKKGNSYNTSQVDCLAEIQSTAVHGKFADIVSAVWQTVYHESMNNVWDEILSERVMDYCDVWLQRNCILNLPSTSISVISDDNIKAQGSHELSPKVFSLGLNVFFFLDKSALVFL